MTQRRWWQDVVIQAAGSLLAAGVIAIVAVLFGVIGSTTLRIVFGVVLIAWTLSLIVIAALFLGTPREARFYVRMYDGWQRRPRVKQLREWRRG